MLIERSLSSLFVENSEEDPVDGSLLMSQLPEFACSDASSCMWACTCDIRETLVRGEVVGGARYSRAISLVRESKGVCLQFGTTVQRNGPCTYILYGWIPNDVQYTAFQYMSGHNSRRYLFLLWRCFGVHDAHDLRLSSAACSSSGSMP